MKKEVKVRMPDTQLPAPFQIGEQVSFEFAPNMTGTIRKIHFDENNVQYDVEGRYTCLVDMIDVPDVVRFYSISGRHILKINNKTSQKQIK